ncbi:hypothetical protein RHMOL_Rhmol05G0063700 [Rhododendron molle]|uniref:Uncharacterized protein n=1 Tax=Rhododendron molle TaxID=49168 RepID=A0ACC0NM16_RHOML|nr:hypothetical protein RHMOL_Rhmol05G0063700 [Rhododendron molle]
MHRLIARRWQTARLAPSDFKNIASRAHGFKLLAAVYFNKIQCFCFEEQRLLPGEQIDMPVFFYIDPEFETDPKMDGSNNLILSYTFFKVSEE